MIQVYICKQERLQDCADRYAETNGLLKKHRTLVYATGGKPHFADEDGLHCSVSHSGSYWVCAIAPQPIGVDVQRREERNIHGIAARFFTPEEQAYLAAGGDFFAVWAAKESYVKYTGEGLQGFLRRSVVQEGRMADRVGEARLCPLWSEGEYTLCVCTEAQGNIECIWMD